MHFSINRGEIKSSEYVQKDCYAKKSAQKYEENGKMAFHFFTFHFQNRVGSLTILVVLRELTTSILFWIQNWFCFIYEFFL